MPKVIGITGGIATGKSTVLKMFGELGAMTLSADDLAREVLSKDTPAYKDTVARFGSGVVAPDGEIDRSALAATVFSDPEARKALNEITHPRIIADMQLRIDRFRSHPPSPDAVLAVEIPLLMECGLEGSVDEVVVVAAEPQTQQSRLTTRSGLSPEDAQRRIASQMPMDRKVERADRVIWNDGSLGSVRKSVRAIWGEIHLL